MAEAAALTQKKIARVRRQRQRSRDVVKFPGVMPRLVWIRKCAQLVVYQKRVCFHVLSLHRDISSIKPKCLSTV